MRSKLGSGKGDYAAALSVIVIAGLATLAVSPAVLSSPARALGVGATVALGGAGTSTLTVASQTTTGAVLNGMYAVLYDSMGTPMGFGYTPAQFALVDGLTYMVSVDNYGSCTFSHWADTGSAVDQRAVSIASDTTVTAVFSCGATTTTTTTSSTGSSTTTTATTSTTTTAPPGSSVLNVYSRFTNGTSIVGLYAVLYQNGAMVNSGYTPAQFTLVNGEAYQVEVEGYGSAYFQYWAGTNWVNALDPVTGPTGSVTGVFCNGACSDSSTAPPPADGVTVYASRIPAGYWDPCFASACSAGTGPGASMYIVLEDGSGNVLQSGYADEWGLTFTGLTPGVTYYVYPQDCNLCHGSAHDVVFQYWTGGSTVRPLAVQVGAVLNAWYSCTNSCAGGP